MTNMKIKITVAVLAVTGAITYLAFAGVTKGWVYYVDVDEFIEQPDYHASRVRICGKASEDPYKVEPAKLHAAFDVVGVKGRVPVVYTGVIPAQFKPGAEVVLEGKLDENGIFQANVLLTKCASKYQAEDHANRLRGES